MALAAFGFVVATAAPRVQPQEKKSRTAGGATASVADGRRIFATTCAGCHGLDGHGSERAPDILTRAELQRMSQADIVRVIRDGVPAKRMPAFGGMLEVAQIRDAAAYLRDLMHGHAESAALPGDPATGKQLFFGKAGCSECHMVGGAGGFLAEDLSAYARLHPAEEIRDTITDPSKNPARGERQVSVVTREGEQLSGVARNEDNFSIQVQSADGAFHFLMKSELQKLEFPPQPLMPADYGQKLSAKELDDLTSFLMRAADASSKSAEGGAGANRDDDED